MLVFPETEKGGVMQPEVTEFTEEEEKEYLRLQKKVGWRRTGTKIFESFFPILTMAVCELAVVRKIDGVDNVLMWRRKDEHYEGWHMPGGYVLVGESDEEWIKRVLAKETRLALKFHFFIRRFNINRTCGIINHFIANFFLCEVEGEPSGGRFFPLTEVPDDTLENHKLYVEHLRAYLLRQKTMRRSKRGITMDGLQNAPEGRWRVVYTNQDYGYLTDDFDSLDKAVKESKLNQANLFDDQGLQIL